MQFQSQHSTIAGRRGSATLVLINLIVLILIVGLGAGYYFFQMRPAMAVEEHAKALAMEKKGHLTSAELAYREAIRLDPSNAYYHQSLELLLSGKGNLDREIVPLSKPGPRSASAALWPEERRVPSTPSLSDNPAEIAEAPRVNTVAAPPLEPVVVRKNVEVEIVAPDGAELELRAANAELYVPGEIVQPWTAVDGRFQRELPPGKYEIAVRLPDTAPGIDVFTVKKEGGVLQGVKFEYGLLKIDTTPEGVEIHEAKSGEVVGETPFAVLRSPGEVAYTLKAEGYESSTLDGAVATRGVLHFNHRLAKVAPEPSKAVAKTAKSKTKPSTPALAETKSKPEKEPEPKVVPAIAQEPVFGRPFVNADGIEFFFGEKSNRGDPFWMSRSTPLKGYGDAAALQYCENLNAKEELAGRVPKGYVYLPSLAKDGRIALCRKYIEVAPGRVIAPDVESPEVTPLVAGQPPTATAVRPTRKAVVVLPAGEAPRAVAQGSGIKYGDSFVNSGRIWMEYRNADMYGNPFWRSSDSIVRGMSLARAQQYCADLTERERAVGRVPAGYAYAIAAEGDGRIVLWRNVLPGRMTSTDR